MYRLRPVSMTIPALSYSTTEMAERVARALNLLGADGNLLDTADAGALLDLIDEFFDEPDDNQGSPTPFNRRVQ